MYMHVHGGDLEVRSCLKVDSPNNTESGGQNDGGRVLLLHLHFASERAFVGVLNCWDGHVIHATLKLPGGDDPSSIFSVPWAERIIP